MVGKSCDRLQFIRCFTKHTFHQFAFETRQWSAVLWSELQKGSLQKLTSIQHIYSSTPTAHSSPWKPVQTAGRCSCHFVYAVSCSTVRLHGRLLNDGDGNLEKFHLSEAKMLSQRHLNSKTICGCWPRRLCWRKTYQPGSLKHIMKLLSPWCVLQKLLYGFLNSHFMVTSKINLRRPT